MDLKKHLRTDQEIRNAKVGLVRLGFDVKDTILSSQDPDRISLLEDLVSDRITYQQFLDQAEKQFKDGSQFNCRTVKCNILYGQGEKKPIIDEKIINIPLRPIKEFSQLPSIKDESGKDLITSFQIPPVADLLETADLPPKQDALPAPAPGISQGVSVIGEEVITGPLWRDLPPKDKGDWINPNVFDYVEQNGVWAIAAASRRGKTHAHEGTHRDDSYAFGFQEGWSIISVADGAGSCRLSRVGAKVGCQKALEHLKNCLKGFKPELAGAAEIPDQSDLLKIKVLLISTMKEVLSAIKEEANLRKIDVDDLSTTMLIVIHHRWKNDKSIIASIQVGDGAIAIWHDGGNVTILGTADSGNFASETKFITSKGIDQEFDHRTLFTFKVAVDAIAAMTDGVADDFFPPEKVMPRMFIEVYDILIGTNSPGEALLNWLSYERRGSFDDRTMAILHRR